MGNFKINSPEENIYFIPTRSYQELLISFKKLKESHGIILHVVGAPGTGKSTNLYHAVKELNMNTYSAKLILEDLKCTPADVFKITLESIKEDLGVKTEDDLYLKLKEFDAVIFADEFHDSHLQGDGKVGFSQWTEYNGWKTISYYLSCIKEFIKHREDFKEINIVLQTAWRIRFRGKKKDLFTDLGFISRMARLILKIPFQVVVISYSTEETISIVNSHFKDVDNEEIRKYIDVYGCKPREICENLK
jgi:hypothetical protein